MRKLMLLALVLLVSRFANAQRLEAGVLLDYLNVTQTDTDNVGLGARLGYRVHRNVMLEGEFSYDYGVNFHEAYIDVKNGNVKAIERTSIGVTDGLIGPMLQPSHRHFRPYVTAKTGFVDFRLSPSLVPYIDVISSVFGIRTSSVKAVLYPGAGAQVSLGPVGLRLEFGDLVYFAEGANNNLRVTLGPIVRF